MAYPQYPGGYNPYPGGYSMPAAAPNGATAIIAGVLAGLGALSNLVGGGFNVAFSAADFGSDLSEFDSTGLLGNESYSTFALVTGIVSIITAVVLGVGAIMLFNRKALGRTLVAAACAVCILSQLVGVVVVLGLLSSTDVSPVSGGLSGIFSIVFPVATLVLALVPATSRWLAHRPTEVPPGYGYPQQGYPQPGYPDARDQQYGGSQPGYQQPGYPQQPPGIPGTGAPLGDPVYSAPPSVPQPGYPQQDHGIPAPSVPLGDPAYSAPPPLPRPDPAYPPPPVPLTKSQDETWKPQGGW
ncbi:DUF4064 domain-containing protein [Nocardia aurea]|uniref:DUF4064 domain-containing protein n=1 Tax=Nocardia aurea TaxID=2144174 RepID=A0ABV3G3J8_9NOCA